MSDEYALLAGDPVELAGDLTAVARTIRGFRLESVDRMSTALTHAGQDGFRLLILMVSRGLNLAEASRVIRSLAKASPRVATLLISAPEDAILAQPLIEAGAAEYLDRSVSPFQLKDRIEALMRPDRTPGASGREPTVNSHDSLSPAGARVLEQIRRVAPIDATILLAGELGSGKTRTARMIHDASTRRDRPFVTLSCGAVSATATEIELFGQARGAYPGADRRHPGKIVEAEDGTLLLDDIDALSPALQGRLLRAIESGMFEPIGSTQPEMLRARLIATSSRPLDQEVAAGRFRSDLYYRINVIEIPLPPLRQRVEEIPAMAHRFVAEFAERCGREVAGIEPDALEALTRHDWPGNVRELRNVLERAVVLGLSSSILLEDLRLKSPPATRPAHDFSGQGGPATLADAKRDAEQARIVEALRKHGNVRLYAARELGISRMTLYKKMYEYGLMERPIRDQVDGQSDGDAA